MKSLALTLLLAATLSSSAQTAPGVSSYKYFRVGAPADIHVQPRAGYALMGGGTDLDEAFRWLCGHAGGGDLLVLRAAGTADYNPYIQTICHLNSVATLIIPDRAAASEAFVTTAITNASALFIAGGDQARYINFWSGTPVEAALRAAIKRGVPIGGTSAGLAVLGQYIYSAQNDKPNDKDLNSDEALADPFYRQVVIAPELLGIPVLRDVITDSHFDTRKREGRLLVFMARILASGKTKTIRGIGVDERTAVLVEGDGSAQVIGQGEADFLEATSKPEVCEQGMALTFEPIVFYPVRTGTGFDLKNWRTDETGATFSVRAGQISVKPSL
jgi:cyanophycinase